MDDSFFSISLDISISFSAPFSSVPTQITRGDFRFGNTPTPFSVRVNCENVTVLNNSFTFSHISSLISVAKTSKPNYKERSGKTSSEVVIEIKNSIDETGKMTPEIEELLGKLI